MQNRAFNLISLKQLMVIILMFQIHQKIQNPYSCFFRFWPLVCITVYSFFAFTSVFRQHNHMHRVPTLLLTKNPGFWTHFPGPPWEIFQDFSGAHECLNIRKKKPKALKADSGVGFLGRGSEPRPHQLGSLGSTVRSPMGSGAKILNLVQLETSKFTTEMP